MPQHDPVIEHPPQDDEEEWEEVPPRRPTASRSGNAAGSGARSAEPAPRRPFSRGPFSSRDRRRVSREPHGRERPLGPSRRERARDRSASAASGGHSSAGRSRTESVGSQCRAPGERLTQDEMWLSHRLSYLLRHNVHQVQGCDTHGFARAVDILAYVNASAYAHDHAICFTREHLERGVESPVRRRFIATFRKGVIAHVRAIQGHSVRASQGNMRIVDSNLFAQMAKI